MKRLFEGLGFRDRLAVKLTSAILIALAILLIISLIPSAFTTLDLTVEKALSLSNESIDLANGVNEDVKILLITSSESKSKVTEAVLGRYDRYGKSISVTRLDADTDRYEIEKYIPYTESAVGGVIVSSERRSLYIPRHLLLSYSEEALASASQTYSYLYSNGETDLNFSEFLAYFGEQLALNDGYCFESRLNAAIRYVTAPEIRRLCFVSGKASDYFSDSIAFWFAANMIETLDTDLDTSDIPSDADYAMVMPAQTDISQKAKTKLSAYIAGGGKVLLASSYGVDTYPNLSALCSEMGLSSPSSYIFDDTATRYFGSPETLLPSLKGGLSGAITEGQSFILPLCTEIRVSETLPEGLSVTPLITTSDGAYVKKDLSKGYAFDEATDTRGERYIGVSAKNTLGGELIFVSSSLMLVDDFDYYSDKGNKTVFFKLLTDGGVTDPSRLAPDPKPISAPLTPNSAAMYAVIAVSVLLSLAAIACGMILGFKRNS